MEHPEQQNSNEELQDITLEDILREFSDRPQGKVVNAPAEPVRPDTIRLDEIQEAVASVATAEGDTVEYAPVEEEPAGLTVEDALAFVDQPLSDLIEAIGEPLEEYYEYSCSGPGDDGLLTYDGFIVFTYREPDGSAEVVIDAEAE